MILVGVPDKPTLLEAFPLILHRRRLAGSVIGGIRETQAMLDFCAEHRIESDVEVIPIQQVNEAYERVLKGDVRFRFVIDLASLKYSAAENYSLAQQTIGKAGNSHGRHLRRVDSVKTTALIPRLR
jgi:hypothetical protein